MAKKPAKTADPVKRPPPPPAPVKPPEAPKPPAAPPPPPPPVTAPAVDVDPKVTQALNDAQARLDTEKAKLEQDAKDAEEAAKNAKKGKEPELPAPVAPNLATGPTGEQVVDPKVALELRERQERIDRQRKDAVEAVKEKPAPDEAARQRVYYPDIAVGPIPKE